MKLSATRVYATIADLDRETDSRGQMSFSALIAAKGLPVDILWLIGGRLALLSELDYQEGSETPLTRRFYVDSAVIDAVQPGHVIRCLVVDRRGARHGWSWKQPT